MVIHSERHPEFLGLRLSKAGQKQVVCETVVSGRVVLNLMPSCSNEAAIEAAFKEAIKERSVMSGLLKALSSRGISFEFAH